MMDHDVEEIDAGEDDEVLERVGAIDVAKASGKVCVRLPGKQRRITRVFDVTATTNAIMALADELAEMGNRAHRRRVDLGLLAAVLLPARGTRTRRLARERPRR